MDAPNEVHHINGLSERLPDLVPATEDSQGRLHLEPLLLWPCQSDGAPRIFPPRLNRPVKQASQSDGHAEIRAFGFLRRNSPTKSSRTSTGTALICA